MEEVAEESKMGFARKLASPNKKSREKAISLLVIWLTSQKQVKEEELKKIWKGLFYCVWHSDKVAVQADLIERLTSVSEKLDRGFSIQFFKVFLVTMRREWAGIDKLRLDKFYLLLRKYLVHMLVVLESSGWDADLIKEFMETLLERTFLAKDQYAALGINLHYAEIFLQELQKFLPLKPELLKMLLEPFLQVCANTNDKPLVQRIRDSIFGPLLSAGRTLIKAKQEGTNVESDVELLGSAALSLSMGPEAFKLASLPSTVQGNRKVLYELQKEFDTLDKLGNGSGVTFSPVDKTQKKEGKVKLSKRKSSEVQIDGGVDESMQIGSGKKEKKKKSKESISNDVSANTEVDTNIPEEPKRTINQSMTDPVVKSKKKKRLLSGSKEKKKKLKNNSTGVESTVTVEETVPEETGSGPQDSLVNFNDPVISNLKRQFDLLAEELAESESCCSPFPSKSKAVSPCNTGSKKRKKVSLANVSMDAKIDSTPCSVTEADTPGVLSTGKSSAKAKKVRFALKKNLVWRPTSPLPPENVRVPPAATPRGSALKKGVPPGPIISETKAVLIRNRKATPRRQKSVAKQAKVLIKRRRSL